MMSSRVLYILSALFLGTLLFSCAESPKEESPFRYFWVIDAATDPYGWYKIRAEKKSESSRAIIYVDVNRTEITTGQISALGQEFDNVIYPKLTQYFASTYDVDGNGKTILVMLDIKDDFLSTGAYIGGYFNPRDLFLNDSMNPYSNEGDIVYIDCYPQIVPQGAKGTLAHEFQHLVNFSKNYLVEGNDQIDTWIDEGLAEAANHLCYGALSDRIDYYETDYYLAHAEANANIDKHPLFYWDESDSLPNYAKSYLFFQFMRAQASSGWGVFKQIIDSSYSDYRCIITAMNNDASLSSWNFDQLLLRWYAANIISSSIPRYSYDPDIGVVSGNTYAPANVNLASGGGVVKSSNGGTFNAPGYIYMSVSPDGNSEDFSGSTYDDLGYFVAVYINGYSTDSGSGISSLPDINFSTARKAAIPPHAIKPKLTTNGVPDNFFRKDITLRKFLDSPGLNKN